MDTMADTSCAGSNWSVLEWTGHSCDVYPFNEEYEATKDVPIATCATLVQGEGGNDFILVRHEMLFFGSAMSRSLLNQNQICDHIRFHKGRVQDDFTRDDEEFGITVGNTFIPFYMDGSAVCFDSRVPSSEEIENLPHVTITSSEPWDPKNKPLRVSAASRDYDHHGNNTYGNDTGTNYRNNYGNITETNHGKHRNITGTYNNYGNITETNLGNYGNITGTYNNYGNITETNHGNHGNITGTYGNCTNTWSGGGFHVNEGNNQPRETDVIIGSVTPHLVESRFCSDMVESVTISSFQVNQHSSPTPEMVSRLWNVGLETAQRMLRATTQQGIHSAVHPIFRHYRVDHLHFHRKRLHATFHTDTLFSKIMSLRGNKCAQVFTNGAFTAVYPIILKSHTGDSLRELINDVGIPDRLYADLAAEHTGRNTEFQQQVHMFHIQMHYAEKGRKNQNHRAEREIGILKSRWKNQMAAKGVPSRLWDYGLVYESEILSRISRAPNERSGIEQLTGETPDISEWLDFSFYDLVRYHKASNDTSTDKRQLGRWLGVSHRVGSALCYWVLTKSGKVISSTTVQHVTQGDNAHQDTHHRIQVFDVAVQEHLSDTNLVSNDIEGASLYIQDYSLPVPPCCIGVVPSDTEYGDMIYEEAPEDDTHDNLDNYIHAQLVLDAGGEQLQGRVMRHATEPDGTKKGMAH